MKKRGVYSDSVMQFLLQGYERPSLSHEAKDNLVRVLEKTAAELGSSYEDRQAYTKIVRFRSAATRLATMAAAIVIFATLGLYVFSSYTAGTPWKLDDAIATAGRPVAGKAIVRADGGERRVLMSENETVVMEAGTVLEVSGNFMHALTRDRSNIYTLKTGSVAVDHTRGSFKLVTPWASIVPMGTVVRASVREDMVRVACDGGAIIIRPFDESRMYTLYAGEAITATRSGDAWIVTTDSSSASGSPDFDQSDQTANPASLSATPEASSSGLPNEPAALAVPPAPAAAIPTPAQFTRLWSIETGVQAETVSDIMLSSDPVYLYSSAAGGDSILKLAREDGSILGSTSLGARFDKHAFHGDRVYLVSGSSLSAIEIGSGAVLWRTVVGPMGFAGLTVEQGRVYLPSADGNLYMIDTVMGTILGKIAAGSGLYGKPLIDSGRLVFSSISKELRSVDGTSLAEVWKASVPGGLVGDSPVTLGALVVTEDMKGNIIAFDRKDGMLAWTLQTGQAETASAFGIGSGVLFSLDGKPTVAFEDGSTMTLAGIDGEILATDHSATILTSSGLYRLAQQDNAAGAGLVGRPIAGMKIGTLRGAINEEQIAVLTLDGRLELWQWMEEK